jgi:hypothetical protein
MHAWPCTTHSLLITWIKDYYYLWIVNILSAGMYDKVSWPHLTWVYCCYLFNKHRSFVQKRGQTYAHFMQTCIFAQFMKLFQMRVKCARVWNEISIELNLNWAISSSIKQQGFCRLSQNKRIMVHLIRRFRDCRITQIWYFTRILSLE